jgi:hypothetical protein
MASAYARAARPSPDQSRSGPSTPGAIEIDRRPYPSAQLGRDTRRMIESKNLSKRFGGRTVVNEVSFAVEP